MSKDSKAFRIFEGLATVAIGVLVAIFGIQAVIDIYFGVLFIVSGVLFLTFAAVALAKTKLLSFGELLAGSVFLTIGIALLAKFISFGLLIRLFVLFVIGAGFALFLYGLYVMIKIHVGYGLGQLALGAVAMTIGILYLTIPGFDHAFWIVIGVLIGLYGLLLFFSALFGKNSDKSSRALAKK